MAFSLLLPMAMSYSCLQQAYVKKIMVSVITALVTIGQKVSTEIIATQQCCFLSLRPVTIWMIISAVPGAVQSDQCVLQNKSLSEYDAFGDIAFF